MRFSLDSIYLCLELGACTKEHDSAWRNHEFLACSRIPSSASSLLSNRKHAKLGDGKRLPFLKSGFEEVQYPIQERGRLLFRDPGFLMHAVGDLNLLHLVLFRLRQEVLVHRTPWDLSINDELAIGDLLKIDLRFRRSALFLIGGAYVVPITSALPPHAYMTQGQAF